jgi:CRISPR-associated protein Csc2
MFPSVVTLRDATPAELAFVLGITAKNKRYGATTSRLGRVNNRILGVYVGSEEGPANLELTRETIARLQADDQTEYETVTDVVMSEALDPSRTAEYVRNMFEDAIDTDGLDLQRVSQESVDSIVDVATNDDLADVLAEQRDHSTTFLDQAE